MDLKVTKRVKMPAATILYAVTADHFVIPANPLKALFLTVIVWGGRTAFLLPFLNRLF